MNNLPYFFSSILPLSLNEMSKHLHNLLFYMKSFENSIFTCLFIFGLSKYRIKYLFLS